MQTRLHTTDRPKHFACSGIPQWSWFDMRI
ncbi:MAG: hypothetical protein D4R82_00345 [Dehalococcoidia bacterium]|nr:MAG: hypothetical protein D4R82_00345 [Dehalococcoidia bacterium]